MIFQKVTVQKENSFGSTSGTTRVDGPYTLGGAIHMNVTRKLTGMVWQGILNAASQVGIWSFPTGTFLTGGVLPSGTNTEIQFVTPVTLLAGQEYVYGTYVGTLQPFINSSVPATH